jgi:hypothetical protein
MKDDRTGLLAARSPSVGGISGLYRDLVYGKPSSQPASIAVGRNLNILNSVLLF